MGQKNRLLELRLGYSLIALCNVGFSLYLLHDTVSMLFPEEGNSIAVVFAAACIPPVFVFPYFDYLTGITALVCGVGIENIDEMSYGERTLRLSFIIFKLVTKVIGIISAALTFLLTVFFSFIFWLVSGSWFEDGLIDSICKLRSSYEITKYVAKIYNTITSIAELAFTKIIEWEKKECDSIVRYRLVEPEMNDIPPVRERTENEDTTYADNITDARAGNTRAQVAIGKYLITYGKIEEGLQWLKKAYLQKEPTAYTAYGNLYMEGSVVQKNEEKAIALYKLGIKGKDPSAMYFLAMYLLEKRQTKVSMDMIIKLLIVSANNGEETASAQLGKLYFEGLRIEKDEKKAFYWLNRAVINAQDYSSAGYYLGRCYLEGIGAEREEKKGFQILVNSVEAGCSRIDEARELIAECYETGKGVKRNTRKAREYRLARAKSECLFDDLADLIRIEENIKNEI